MMDIDDDMFINELLKNSVLTYKIIDKKYEED